MLYIINVGNFAITIKPYSNLSLRNKVVEAMNSKVKCPYFSVCSYLPVSFFPTFLKDLNKRLSLPADIRIPDGYLEKLQINSPPFDQPMSRRSRRASLVSF